MILITGANGHFGKATIEHLIKEVPVNTVSGLVRSEEKGADLRSLGVPALIGDYDDPASLAAAMRGVEKLLLVSGSDLEHRVDQHRRVIDAARQAGVRQVVYTSFYREHDEGGALGAVAAGHVATERYIRESGIDYTFLLNTLYAEVLPLFFGPAVLDQGIYLPAGDGRISVVERDEMARAAAAVLAGEGHAGKSYVLANTRNYSMRDIAALLTEISGHPVTYTPAEPDAYRQAMQDAGVPAEAIGMTETFCRAIANGEFKTAHSDLPLLLDREPLPLRDFIQRTYG